MAKKKTAKSTAETPSTTTLSVRFSETELEHLKEASILRGTHLSVCFVCL